MKRSVARKYFLISSLCVFISVVILGVVFLVFSTRFFEGDKYTIMRRNAMYAASITEKNYFDNNYDKIEVAAIAGAYMILSSTSDSDFLLADVNGQIFFHSNPAYVMGEEFPQIPENLIVDTVSGGYENTGIVPGIVDQPSYIVGVPIMSEGTVIATVFVVASADSLVVFLSSVTQMFLLTMAVSLVISFIIIYYATKRMVSPLQQMVEATHSFSKGDFTKRIAVINYDEIGQLAMAFNNMASALATNEGSRRSFIANVSHELKTPMTTIGGFVDGMIDGTIPQEKHKHYLKIVSSEAKRLTRLVHSMLDMARLESGELERQDRVFDISELVRQSVFSFEQSIEEKELLLTGLDKDKIMVNADPDLIHQVVYNLVENAVKFVDKNGEITVFYKEVGDKVYTTIRNTGDGLSREEAAKIFERFYKSDRSRSGHRSGVGLGLHIVKSIINEHHGEIKVDSVEGKYTEFTFAIPSASKAGLN